MSAVRRAIYVLGVPAALLLGWTSLGGMVASSTEATAATNIANAAAVSQASAGPAQQRRLAIQTRQIASPRPRDAAAAYNRGDYLEALAQYRALARLDPEQRAYRTLISILERRLDAKKPGE